MTSFYKRRARRHHHRNPRIEEPELAEQENSEYTDREAAYLRSLVDSRAIVTVVLTTGERLRGRIRYYDRDCFSLGPAGGGPKIFLRKSSVRYLCEE